MRERGGALFALLMALAAPASARAFDVALDTDTSFQVYEVRSPGARAFMARRRLLSRLSVRLTHDLEEPDDEGRALRITAEAQLRLEQEFGSTCLVDADLCVNAVDADDPGAWQPLAADTVLDVPAVWGEISGLPLGTAVRVGRQLVLDPIGFVRFDGIRARVVPLRWIRVEAMAGRVVRGTSLAGTSRSDPQGSIRLDSADRVPWAAPPVDTWVAGASVSGGPGRALQLRLSYRHMWEPDGDVLSRLGAAASSQPVDGLRIDASGVYDLLTDEVILASGRVAVGDDTLRGHAGIQRHVPRFDPGTIWAWFSVAPITQGDLGARWKVTDDLSLGGSLRTRHAELGDDGQDDDLDFGGDGWFRARWERFVFGASGFLWSGALGPLAGTSLHVERRLFGFVELALDVSVWHFDDPHRPDVYGTVLSEVLSARFRITPETLVFAELQHATSRRVGHRFRGVLAVRVDTWR
ncbi:MAG TPA: hypothetical protein RMH99_31770 [Sandaracinaceae bacterium LLY-WYZ-13_1]|nr:hypothetical protein [Sandaracinaceae bacterium LLY-WYZ-13_1]